MSYSATALLGTRRQLRLQVVLLAVAASAVLLFHGAAVAIAILFGGAIGIANTLLELWYLHRTDRVTSDNPAKSIGLLYRYALQRFLLTITLFGLGLGWMKLHPLMLITGFLLAQAALIFRWFSETKLRRTNG